MTAVKITSKWEKWFAIIPVEVEAYDVSEIKDGKLRYRAVGTVLRRWVDLMPENYENSQDEIPAHWEYKPFRAEDIGR